MSVMKAEHLSFHADVASGDKISLKQCDGWLWHKVYKKKFLTSDIFALNIERLSLGKEKVF